MFELCRLLGYVADRPTSVVAALGESAFEAFTSLAAVHGDGWGMSWRAPDDGTTQVAASAASAATDPAYGDLAGRALGAAGLVHLRWATDGLDIAPANTHPFTDGDYALAHNGSIAPIDRLEGLLSESSRAKLVGDTDSERYFGFVLQCIVEDSDEVVGVTRAVGALHQAFPESSLNALLLTPSRLFGIHVNSRAQTPIDDLRELFESEDVMPAGHATAYFDMAYRVTPHAVHVVSSGLTDGGWTSVPPDTVLMVDLASRDVTALDPLISVKADKAD